MDTSFQRTTGSDEWYTPRELIDSLGTFDLDPCAPLHPLWPTAKKMYNIETDGLKQSWGGVGYGLILHILNHLSPSSVNALLTTVMASASCLAGQAIKSFRRLCCRELMPCCSFASGLSSTDQTEHREAAAVATPFYSPSGARMQKLCFAPIWKVSLFHSKA